MTEVPMSWADLPNAPQPGVVLAQLNDIPDAGARLLSLGDGPQAFPIILLRSGDSALAYVNRCMHFGVPLASKVEHLHLKPQQSIRCSVHYARYRWHDGFCEYGECEGEYLLAIPVAVLDGEIVVLECQKRRADDEGEKD